MQIENTTQRWGIVQQTLHWVIAAAIAIQLAVGFRMAGLPDDDPGRALMLPLHATTGLSILGLALFRLYWRRSHPVPTMPDTLSPSEKGLAHTTHYLLYTLLIGMPIVGYLLVSSYGVAIPFFGANLAPVIAESAVQQRAMAGLHYAGAIILMLLVALHITAALRHAWLLRDGVMERMTPWLPSTDPTNSERSPTAPATTEFAVRPVPSTAMNAGAAIDGGHGGAVAARGGRRSGR